MTDAVHHTAELLPQNFPLAANRSKPHDDPLSLLARVASKLKTLWLVHTYPFVTVGRDLSVHYSCEFARPTAHLISIGEKVRIGRDAWINIPTESNARSPVIVLGDRSIVGRRCVISAANSIRIEDDVIFAPSVLVMDHNHAFQDISSPIASQGITEGGTIRIETGCWLGYGSAIVCSQGELVIGKQSVIGANSVITRSVPPYSVVTGNPARVVKQFDPAKGEWVLGSAGVAGVKRSV